MQEVSGVYKRLNQWINILTGCFIGGFFGYSGFLYWDYKTHPMIYELQSAPWYTGILMYGVILAVLLAVCVVIKIMLWIKMKQER